MAQFQFQLSYYICFYFSTSMFYTSLTIYTFSSTVNIVMFQEYCMYHLKNIDSLEGLRLTESLRLGITLLEFAFDAILSSMCRKCPEKAYQASCYNPFAHAVSAHQSCKMHFTSIYGNLLPASYLSLIIFCHRSNIHIGFCFQYIGGQLSLSEDVLRSFNIIKCMLATQQRI